MTDNTLDNISEETWDRHLALSNLYDSFDEELHITPKPEPDYLYHYTGQFGFNGIVREDSITLRFTKVGCLSDDSEGKYIFDQFRKVLADMYKEGSISTEFLEIASSIDSSKTKQRLFIYPLHSSPEEQTDDNDMDCIDLLECNAFIYCLTHEGNSPYMWENYVRTDNGCGYRLGFDPGNLVDFGRFRDYFGEKTHLAEGLSYRVVYDKEQQYSILRKYIRRIYDFCAETNDPKEINSLLISMLQVYSLVFKKAEFFIEDEYRMVVFMPVSTPSWSKVDRFPVGCTIENKEYIEIAFDKDILQEVCLDADISAEIKKIECATLLADYGYKETILTLRPTT